MDGKFTVSEYIQQYVPEFTLDKCFGLVIAAKELKPKASSVYGFVVTSVKGDKVFDVYFGTDVPDSSLAYDRLPRASVMENIAFSDAYKKLCEAVPEDSIMFSASADTWASRIFASIPEVFPTVVPADKFRHVDIIKFCDTIDDGYPPQTDDLKRWIDTRGGSRRRKRTSLDSFAVEKGIQRNMSIPGTQERAEIISTLVRTYFDKIAEDFTK